MEIKIKEVNRVTGKSLSDTWSSDMITITDENGNVYIDNMPGAKHSIKKTAWYGYDNWENMKGKLVDIKVTNVSGYLQNKTSKSANYNIWVKHPDVNMVA